MEAEHITKRDGEEQEGFLSRITFRVGKGRPDELVGVAG